MSATRRPQHPSEDTDAPRGRISTADQTAADIARAQLALAEIAARAQADAARKAEEAALRDDLARGLSYGGDDVDETDREDELVDNY